jgi:hypothetical protein
MTDFGTAPILVQDFSQKNHSISPKI